MERNNFNRISQLIYDYSIDPVSQGEMLPKSPEQLALIYQRGLSYVLLDNEQPIAHAALWPLMDGHGIKVYEFGSWITDPNFRHHRLNGMTGGELAAYNLLQQVDDQVAVIATIKRLNTKKGLEKLGAQPMSFHNFPFVSGLTCSCVTSEHSNSKECGYRRRINFGETVIESKSGPIFHFDKNFRLQTEENDPPRLPCTLMGIRMEAVINAEVVLAQLFQETMGESLYIGSIDQRIMDQLKVFYQKIGVSL